MGLDIYIYRAKREGLAKRQARMKEIENEEDSIYSLEREEFEKPEIQEKLKALQKECKDVRPYTEIAYFRKVNLLVSYFNYQQNCTYQELSKENVESLVEDCQKVLDLYQQHQGEDITDKLEDLLPTTSGFFFGRTDYDKWYFKDVEYVLNEFTKILTTTNWRSEIVYLYCWW